MCSRVFLRLILLFLLMVSVSLLYGGTGYYSQNDSHLVHVVSIVKPSSDTLPVIIYVSFTVGTKGKIYDVEVIKTKCMSCGAKKTKEEKKMIKQLKKECVRVVQNMPNWDTHDTPVRYTVPIKFVFKDGYSSPVHLDQSDFMN